MKRQLAFALISISLLSQFSQAYAQGSEGYAISSDCRLNTGASSSNQKLAMAKSRMSAWFNAEDIDQDQGGGSVRMYFKKEDSGVSFYGPAYGYQADGSNATFATHMNKDNSDSFGISDNTQSHWISLDVPSASYVRNNSSGATAFVTIKNTRKGRASDYTARVLFGYDANRGRVYVQELCLQ